MYNKYIRIKYYKDFVFIPELFDGGFILHESKICLGSIQGWGIHFGWFEYLISGRKSALVQLKSKSFYAGLNMHLGQICLG